jgi:hypothetical protein
MAMRQATPVADVHEPPASPVGAPAEEPVAVTTIVESSEEQLADRVAVEAAEGKLSLEPPPTALEEETSMEPE